MERKEGRIDSISYPSLSSLILSFSFSSPLPLRINLQCSNDVPIFIDLLYRRLSRAQLLLNSCPTRPIQILLKASPNRLPYVYIDRYMRILRNSHIRVSRVYVN